MSDSVKLELDDDSLNNCNDAFISGYEHTPVDSNSTLLVQQVPSSPFQSPLSPLDLTLLDPELIEKNSVHSEPFPEPIHPSQPMWEDTYTDLFDLVA